MASEFPSTVLSKGPSWRGFNALKFLVIFGDSYSDVGYDPSCDLPTLEEPLGVEFPGITYAEPDGANWVGHLITNYSSTLLVYDYAKGGARANDVKNQIQATFTPHTGQRPPWTPWTAEVTLFVSWVGINDAAWSSEHAGNLEILFEGQETLYNSGAKNFLFINIPQISRAPAKGYKSHYINWNTELKKAVAQFAAAHADATVMIFSALDTFDAIFNDPAAHGFPAEDVSKAGASIWVDYLHPTSKVHDFVARDVAAFLSAQTAFQESD
ncbi:hypothetical protein C8F04DRAFT_1046409 [Mycena alexandri]|uniref:Carbohydrate esterase family 16 protein n=1 Tax=Mycena alexandri TaxID=1745969 RepID=A0AAD6WW63_9AGAR|nr:hypothetical protein C8F04DRAFT_1046409 [Mycena alexandri]